MPTRSPRSNARVPRKRNRTGRGQNGQVLYRPPDLCDRHRDPDFARRGAVDRRIADRAVSDDRAAVRADQRAIRRCVGRDDRKHRRASDRAADERARSLPVHVVHFGRFRAVRHHRHLRRWNKSGHCAGSGPEQVGPRDTATAADGAAEGRHRHEIEQRLSADRRRHLDRSEHVALRHLRLPRLAPAGPGEPGQWRGPGERVRYAVCNAHLARHGEAQQLPVDAGRREQRHHEPERAGRGRSARRHARTADAAPHRNDHRSDAAAHARGVRQHPAEGQHQRLASAGARRRAHRPRRRNLLHRLTLHG